MIRKINTTILYLKEKGFFELLSVNFLTQFLGFGSVLLVAKFLTPVELGDVKILQSYTAIFVVLAGFGFNTAVLKTCAENRTDEEKAGILRLALSRSAITTMVALFVIIGLSLSGVTISSRLSLWLIIYACSIPLQVATSIFIFFLQAQKKIKEMARAQIIIKTQSVVLVIIGTWLWGFKGFIFATMIAYLLGLWPFIRQIGLNFLTIRLEKTPATFTSYAVFSVLANGVGELGRQGDIFILDRLTANREAIGYYSLAVIFAAAAVQVTSTVQTITIPYFSQRAKDNNWFRHELFLNQIRTTALSIFVAGVTYVGASFLIPIVYGASYSSTLSYLAILLLRYIVWSSYALIGVGFFSLGLIRYNLIVSIITVPLGFVFSALLLKKMGIIGVAYGQLLSAIIAFVCMLLILKFTISRFH